MNLVSLNTLVHFVHNFPEEVFTLDMDLDWNHFYNSKKEKELISYTIENGQKRIYAPTGEPLLLVCIKNEVTNKSWPLKEMLTILLDSGDFALTDRLLGDPLKVALDYNCFESISIMKSKDYGFDFQMIDYQGISFLGYLMEKLQNEEEDTQLFKDISHFGNTVFDKINIDLHTK